MNGADRMNAVRDRRDFSKKMIAAALLSIRKSC